MLKPQTPNPEPWLVCFLLPSCVTMALPPLRPRLRFREVTLRIVNSGQYTMNNKELSSTIHFTLFTIRAGSREVPLDCSSGGASLFAQWHALYAMQMKDERRTSEMPLFVYNTGMNILWLDPFHGGSHAAIANGYAQHSRHEVVVLPLSIAGGWRWRMRGAAVTLARHLRARPDARSFDLIVATDMLDVATFLGLTRDITANVPVAVYFHENQLTYPLPAGRTRDLAFPWANYTSALAADAVLFNSEFHRRALLAALPSLINRFHDHQERDLIDQIAAKSHVLSPGIDLRRLNTPTRQRANVPTLLWNSRWEYDKNPAAFFTALQALEARGIDFRLIVAGEHVDPNHADFLAARERFGAKALAWGYAPDTARYAQLLHQAEIVVSTAEQEFFGISLVEAMACGCVPIAPRRLSYPEVIPASIHELCLYASDADLVEKLAAAIRGLPAHIGETAGAAAWQYDWSHMAPRYDAMMETVRPQHSR